MDTIRKTVNEASEAIIETVTGIGEGMKHGSEMALRIESKGGKLIFTDQYRHLVNKSTKGISPSIQSEKEGTEEYLQQNNRNKEDIKEDLGSKLERIWENVEEMGKNLEGKNDQSTLDSIKEYVAHRRLF